MFKLLSTYMPLEGLFLSLVNLPRKKRQSFKNRISLFTQGFHCSTPKWKSVWHKFFPQGDLFSEVLKDSIIRSGLTFKPAPCHRPHEQQNK